MHSISCLHLTADNARTNKVEVRIPMFPAQCRMGVAHDCFREGIVSDSMASRLSEHHTLAGITIE